MHERVRRAFSGSEDAGMLLSLEQATFLHFSCFTKRHEQTARLWAILRPKGKVSAL